MSNEKRCCPTDAPPAKCHYAPQGEDLYMVGPIDAKAGILLVSDIFGMLANSKRLADNLAKEGFLVVMPDFFGKKAWLEDNFPPKSFTDPEWLAFYDLISNLDTHRPKALAGISLLKQLGCKKVGVVGLCWGGLLTFDLSSRQAVDAAATAHPAFLTPEIVSGARTPVCLLPSVEETDYEPVEKAFQALKVEPKVFKHYQTIHHGFLGSRYNPETATDVEKKDVAEAQQKIVDFFKATLTH